MAVHVISVVRVRFRNHGCASRLIDEALRSRLAVSASREPTPARLGEPGESARDGEIQVDFRTSGERRAALLRFLQGQGGSDGLSDWEIPSPAWHARWVVTETAA